MFSIDFNLFLLFYYYFFFSLAIKTALKQENLNPEIEEKLIQLQRYQEKQMKQEPETPTIVNRVTTPTAATRSSVRKRPPSMSMSSKEDVDWLETPKRGRPNRPTSTEMKMREELR